MHTVTVITNFDLRTATASRLRIDGVVAALAASGIESEVVSLTSGTRSGARADNRTALRKAFATASSSSDALIFDERLAPRLRVRASDLLLVYGTSSGLLRAAFRHARNRDIPVLLDVVEWYSNSHLRGGSMGPWAIANTDSMRRLSMHADRVLAISSFLGRHFQSRGLESLVVPPLFSPTIRSGLPPARDDTGIRHLCFAGTIGGKDSTSLKNAVAALQRLDPAGRHLRLHVIGPSLPELAAALGTAQALPVGVVPHGRISHREALALVSQCHFTILQRPSDARYAQAGFPSKVAESLVLGTPVAANLTSDLDRYLVDGMNAVVLAGDSIDDMARGIERVQREPLRWTRSQIQGHADAAFAPESHAEAIAEFVSRPRRARRR